MLIKWNGYIHENEVLQRLCFYCRWFVCVCVCRITQKAMNGFWWGFLGGVGDRTRNDPLNLEVILRMQTSANTRQCNNSPSNMITTDRIFMKILPEMNLATRKSPLHFTPLWRVNLRQFFPVSEAVILAIGKNKCLECQRQKQGCLHPSQLFPFPSVVLTLLKNDAAKGKAWETTEYNLSKAILQNRFYSTYIVPPV